MNKVMLITGAAVRIGAYITQAAHEDGYNIVMHYRYSKAQTQDLQNKLNQIRPNSCISVQADFDEQTDFSHIINTIESTFGRLDVLINNASDFFPTTLDDLNEVEYNKLFNSNVKGPLFLSQACLPLLKKAKGTIINLVDIHADKPLKNYPIYSMAKAANKMMVKALAKEMAPEVRVNGISPGCILMPLDGKASYDKEDIINRTALGRQGSEHNLYHGLKFLIKNDYMTGEIIKVDGGRSLHM